MVYKYRFARHYYYKLTTFGKSRRQHYFVFICIKPQGNVVLISVLRCLYTLFSGILREEIAIPKFNTLNILWSFVWKTLLDQRPTPHDSNFCKMHGFWLWKLQILVKILDFGKTLIPAWDFKWETSMAKRKTTCRGR